MEQYFLTPFSQLQGEVRQRNLLWRNQQNLVQAMQTLSDQLQEALARCPNAQDTLTAAHATLQDALEQAKIVLDTVSH